jgi:glycosyltransferase involved in cell wall biosynthesis
LWFNWRDIKHPDAGGAEIYTHQIMIRLVAKGHTITLFSSKSPNNPETECLDGINIIRRGGKYSVYKKAREYSASNKGKYDLIVDEVNARPFLRPDLVNGTPVLALFHQLIKEEWFYETSFPLNYLCCYFLEKRWLLPYRDTPTVTVSPSSMQDLISLGYSQLYLVPNGINIGPLSKLALKEAVPTIVFIGRLKKHKLPHHALEAFQIIKRTFRDSKMWIIGDGEMKASLERRIPKDVFFFGRVSELVKYDLLSRAHLVLMPSVREGWGLVVTEANAMGTPVIGYNVPGLRDSIQDRKTGILSEFNSPSDMANHAIHLLNNQNLLENYSYEALNYSKKFSWEKSGEEFDHIAVNVVNSHQKK